jgi:hypothetical protein
MAARSWSRPRRAIVGDALPSGVAWRDLGAFRLRDFPEPERLSQLDVDGLTTDFPVLRTIDARPTTCRARSRHSSAASPS